MLVAADENTMDQKMGFTDIITSPWLYLTPSCSFNVRLTFQFSIENEQDQIEVFLIKKDKTQISSIGIWKALQFGNNSLTENIESLWQQANVTFKAAAEFRVRKKMIKI